MEFCQYHQCKHESELIEQFKDQCNRLGIVVGNRCPIALIMENPTQLNLIEPEYQVFNQDCTKMEWPENVDLMFTKMPATEKEGFTRGLAGYIANKAFNSMNNNTLAFVLVSSYKEEKVRPYIVADTFRDAGFTFIDTIVWVKNKFIPTQGSKRLNNVYDFIFMFSKGDNYHLDRESIAYLKNRIDMDDSNNEYLCGGNVWKIKVDDKDFVPFELVECVMRLANLLPNSLVIDPFMGSGATLKVALNNLHSFWGCESDAQRFKRCKRIIREYRNAIKKC